MFEDILEALRNPSDEGVDYAALADTLESQAATLAHGYEETLAQKESANTTLAKEYRDLQAHNYTLMMKTNTSDKSSTDAGKTENSDAISGINDLF